MRDCPNIKVSPSQACEEHQAQWRAHAHVHSSTNLSGIKRMLQRPGESVPGKLQSKGQVFKFMTKHHGQKEIDHIFLVL